MAVFGYCRVSTTEQNDGTSLESQVAAVKLAGATAVFQDEGVSGGTPLSDRPAGAKLMEAIQPGDTIVAAKLDRLFRSSLDALATVDDFKTRGIKLILVDMGVAPVNENGVARLFFTMLAAFADFERGRIAERTAEGRAAKAARGGATGTTPFGYRKIGIGKSAMLEAIPEQQEAIARMKDLRSTGLSLRAIADAIQGEFGFTITAPTVDRIVKAA
jgi:DNA invertase Pin-like site-specific DNA recombinase